MHFGRVYHSCLLLCLHPAHRICTKFYRLNYQNMDGISFVKASQIKIDRTREGHFLPALSSDVPTLMEINLFDVRRHVKIRRENPKKWSNFLFVRGGWLACYVLRIANNISPYQLQSTSLSKISAANRKPFCNDFLCDRVLRQYFPT